MKRDLFTPGRQARNSRSIPYDFVLAALTELTPFTRPMFGAHSVYVDERIIFILREKEELPQDNGVWIATTPEHHESLEHEFPSLRPISIFGEKSQWRILPVDAPDFEESVVKACLFVLKGDPRIGKVPKAKAKKKPAVKKGAKAAKKKTPSRKPAKKKAPKKTPKKAKPKASKKK